MPKLNGLLKNFLVYGIGLLGTTYIVSTKMAFTTVFPLINYDYPLEVYLLKLVLIFLACIFTIFWVVRRIWLASISSEGRTIWVYPLIAFVLLTSVCLLALNFLIFGASFVD